MPRALTILLILLASLASCGKREHAAQQTEVILYSSVDDALLREVVKAFESESGITVRIVGDTEATKTTGLVERLLSEKARPRADVWWSSEPFGTVRLAREGVLAPYTSPAEADFQKSEGKPWPSSYRAPDKTWYAFAPRLRVIVYNTKLVPEPPASEAALLAPRLKGRVGIARPQFGTTRGHMGFLLHTCGEPSFRQWAHGLSNNNVRLFDGNATVVRAVAQGEIEVGLTDTDDVYAGQREGWPVAMIIPSKSDAPGAPGPMAVPNTVALVKGAPHPEPAARLIDFILSEETERLLASSDSKNAPMRSKVAIDLKLPQAPDTAPSAPDIASAIPKALEILESSGIR